ncbi:30S ribosomal protein S12 methylthiotransferase RimO [Thermomicrobium sp. 4228-Ro]|uniref:30S ribosomal protein S12 methylthiotransferase RimO n=1 Tax=Thermomicrobium sp. 4228-Ro TaxID=2993937 RepID=UPI002249569F|nr:30S ribosomal protein S12 methylthiotransferase RimO [Thermomicrobium sp. 4228-Ro]MCX2727489.1 30S ribosomal protein S12 methylthiotransferase RimO [Thermomicrobium sp. 4228-Ro]
MTPPIRFHIVTLGCSKNQVDSEGMAQRLIAQGLEPTDDPRKARVLIVNTCGFLAAARAESRAAIERLLAKRRPDQIVIAAGCMVSLDEHRREVPEGVDALLSTREWTRIDAVVAELLGLPIASVRADEAVFPSFHRLPTARPSAYVKIADGCDHRCSFCAIPLIKGNQVSKRPSDVVREIRELVDTGSKEVVLVAQDTIRYGADLGIRDGLPGLLRLIAEQVPELPWLRLLYLYPTPLLFRLIDTMAELPQCVPYLDIPLQHADPTILRAMARPSDPQFYRRLIAYARERLPNVTLRTTFIVGFPGETEEHFHRLYEFVAEMQFDHVGVFVYSPESPTPSVRLGAPVSLDIAEERRARLMALQQRISLEKNRALIGQVLPVLIEGQGELEDERGRRRPIAAGRAPRHAPEVDGLVFVPGRLPIGQIVPVRITHAEPYDLWAEPVAPLRTAPRRNSQRTDSTDQTGRKTSH